MHLLARLVSHCVVCVGQVLLFKGLARSKPCYGAALMTAIITLALRPLLASDLSVNLMTLFMLNILSVPAVMHHVSAHCSDVS